jgi:hypothetical protein
MGHPFFRDKPRDISKKVKNEKALKNYAIFNIILNITLRWVQI